MSLLARVLPSIANNLRLLTPKWPQSTTNFHCLASPVHKVTTVEYGSKNAGGLFNLVTRSIVRDHFPRPSERKRVKRHGWKKRMSTPEGRRILMNRILKGRWVYSH